MFSEVISPVGNDESNMLPEAQIAATPLSRTDGNDLWLVRPASSAPGENWRPGFVNLSLLESNTANVFELLQLVYSL